MSCRTPRRLGLAALAAATLAACNDTSTQPQPQIDPGPPANLIGLVTTTCKTKEIYQIVTWLTPLRDAPMDLRGPVTVALTFSTTRQALARQIVMKLAEAITPAVIDRLNTPPAFSTLNKQEAVALFIADIMECAGIPATQAPPPGAYGPSGGLKVMDQAGGQLLSRDNQALFDVPGTTTEGGPAVTGPHLFAMAEVPLGSSAPSITAAASSLCLPPRENVMEVGRCYDFSVTPDVGAKALGQGFGGRGVYTAVCSPGGLNPDHSPNPDDEVHNYLELAKVNHEDQTKFTIYERQQRSAAEALVCDLGTGPAPPSASALGGAWSKLAGALAVLARPFTPTIARASDGIGHDLFDYTHARLVYQTKPMTVSPSSASLAPGGSVDFTATGPRPGPYVWLVNDVPVTPPTIAAAAAATIGTLAVASDGKSARYTAPTSLPSISTFKVCVRRAGAPADKGCSTITLGQMTAGVIGNGTVSLGVNPLGHLIVPDAGTPSLGSPGVSTTDVGMRYVPTNAEALATGVLAEGWGVAHAASVVTGHTNADPSDPPVNVTVESFIRTATEARSVVRIGSTFRVTHHFRPLPSTQTQNLYEITVTIENISASSLTDVLYRRVLDWDIEPTRVNEIVTAVGTADATGTIATSNPFISTDPLSLASGTVSPFFDIGPGDLGTVFDLKIASLPSHGINSFILYYGAAGTLALAKDAVVSVGASFVSLARPTINSAGIGNTFIAALTGIGGTPLTLSDMEAPVVLTSAGGTPLTVRSSVGRTTPTVGSRALLGDPRNLMPSRPQRTPIPPKRR